MSGVKPSYRAEGPFYGLWVAVTSYRGESAVTVTWSTKSKGDQPDQGHLWTFTYSSPKSVSTLAHAVNVAAWACRKALAGQMQKRR